MTTYTTYDEARHAGWGLLSEADGTRSREKIIIAAGSGVVNVMTVLGKVTATGKYVPSPAALTTGIEGAEVAVCVNLYPADATSQDVDVSAIVRAAEINASCLSYDATRNTDALKNAALLDLASHGVIAR